MKERKRDKKPGTDEKYPVETAEGAVFHFIGETWSPKVAPDGCWAAMSIAHTTIIFRNNNQSQRKDCGMDRKGGEGAMKMLKRVPGQEHRLPWRLFYHHLPLAVGTVGSVAVLFVTRPDRDWISRASFATAYPALLLLIVTLCVGPLNLLRKQRNPISSDFRRDVGIWAGVIGLAHAVVGQCVHLRGRPWLYYVYEHRLGHLVPLRHDLFGFANFSGLLASLVLLTLLATSNNLSLRSFGTPRWKQLQRWNYLCFGLAAIHTILYQISEGKVNSLVIMGGIGMVLTLILQLSGYTLRRQRRLKR